MMTKRFIPLFIFFFFVGLHGYSQDSTLLGTWKLKDKNNKSKLPKTLTFDLVNDSLIVIISASDSLNYTRIITSDAKSVKLKSVFLNPKNNKFSTEQYNLSLNEDGDKLKVEDPAGKMILEYAFQMQCCSNHAPNHCTDNIKVLQKLKENGCVGFHRPK